MLQVLAVGLGGFVGAVGRYALSSGVARLAGTRFPFGTLVVNVLGCLVLGLVVAAVQERGSFSPGTRLFLIAGVLGSLTTFSTFSYDTLLLLRDGDWQRALWNAAASFVLGLGAVAAGWSLGERVWGGAFPG